MLINLPRSRYRSILSSLIGKKAGKKIKPGDKLQVTNPKGSAFHTKTGSGHKEGSGLTSLRFATTSTRLVEITTNSSLNRDPSGAFGGFPKQVEANSKFLPLTQAPRSPWMSDRRSLCGGLRCFQLAGSVSQASAQVNEAGAAA
jgi:hypothetical protein